MRRAPRPSRRAVLLLGATATVSACTQGAAGTGAVPSPPVDPDDALRDAAAARERALLREYDGVLLALPELAARLLPLRGHHAEHLLALVGPPPTPETGSPSLTAVPAPAVPEPADATAALARLRTAEATAGDGHAEDCLGASRGLAALLASLSAGEHSHLVALA